MAGKNRQTTNVKRQTLVRRTRLKTRLQLVFSILFIVIGCGLVFFVATKNFDFSPKKPPEVKQSNNVTAKEKAHNAVSITIPAIAKTLPIEDGTYANGRWTVSKNGVSYYTKSVLPGEVGNSVLYGHDRKDVLGNIYSIKVGDQIQIKMDNGDMVVYEVYETRTIKPTDVAILNQTTDSRLTLYTCSGFLDTARFVVLGKLL